MVATDCNARAAAFARLTMALNGVANVEARRGQPGLLLERVSLTEIA